MKLTAFKKILPKASALLLSLVLTFMLMIGAASADSAGTTPIYSKADLFTERDMIQEADLSEAEMISVTSGEDVRITSAGVYVLSGTASETTIYVEADSEDKVQLVLKGLNITNETFPCIYVITADKVFITTSADSSLSVTGTFRKDGSTKTDGVVFSKQDLVLNGTAALSVSSTANGIVCKDDLKITGGTYRVQAAKKAIEANDSIRIADGVFELTAGTDGLHAENSDDDSLGWIWIGGGSITIKAGDDGIHAVSVLQIDGGTFNISSAEGMEATVIQINGGTVGITSSDDGINAASKSSAYQAAAIFNGGEISISIGAGDTDGVDSNGDIYVNGGTISVNGNSTFDYDGTAQYNGGTIICNGQQVASIPNQMMGGRGGWGNNGGWQNNGGMSGGQGGPGGQGGGRGGRGGWR